MHATITAVTGPVYRELKIEKVLKKQGHLALGNLSCELNAFGLFGSF